MAAVVVEVVVVVGDDVAGVSVAVVTGDRIIISNIIYNVSQKHVTSSLTITCSLYTNCTQIVGAYNNFWHSVLYRGNLKGFCF